MQLASATTAHLLQHTYLICSDPRLLLTVVVRDIIRTVETHSGNLTSIILAPASVSSLYPRAH